MSLYQQYLETRERRLALGREAAVLEQQEKDLLYEMTKSLDLGNIGYSYTEGGYCMKASRKISYKATDWGLLIPYIKETGDTDLLQKRITESAVKARWDDGNPVPGTDQAKSWAVEVTKEAK